MNRNITPKQERAYRLCHHNFEGLKTSEAAKRMGISQRQVQQLLQEAKRKAPQLFPILTERQRQVQDYACENGFSFEQIAELLGVSEFIIAGIVRTLRKKGVYLEKRKPTVQYQNWMDNQKIEKF